MSSQAAEIMRDVARRAEKYGICKGDMHDEDGRSCLHGHVREAMHNLVLDHLTGFDFHYQYHCLTSELGQAIAGRLEAEGLPVAPSSQYPGAAWNDAAATTATDIAKFALQVADDLEFAGDEELAA